MPATCLSCKNAFDVSALAPLKKGDQYDYYACPACSKPVRVAAKQPAAAQPVAEKPPSPPPIPGWLVIKNDSRALLQRLPLQAGMNVVGRYSTEKPADVRIETLDTAMSRRHCQVEVVRDSFRGHYTFWVRDLGSANGTSLKAGPQLKLLHEQDIVQLKDGESLLLGETLVLLEVNPEAAFVPVVPKADATMVSK